MKQLITILVTLTIILATHAQKNFQGEITYRLHSNFEEKTDAELKVLFGVNKLKLRFKEKETYNKNEVLILLDSAAIYTLNADDKTFQKKLLLSSSLAVKTPKKSFGGYGSTLVQPDNNVIGTLLMGMAGSANTFLYVSDSLFYTVPEAFASNLEFSMLQKNKIVLGVEIEMKNNFNEPADTISSATKQVIIEAVAIQPMTVSDTAFAIPSDYENIMNKTIEAPTVAAAVDTVVTADKKPKKPVKKKTTNSGKTKKTTQSSAVRRKQ
jgi:hypothetical protein